MFETEFDFTLPRGYFDGEGNLHRQGVMRLAKAMDEIVPMRDPRVRSNPAYATVLILSRVIVRLGVLDEITPRVIEDLYAIDLNYLYDLYQEKNQEDRLGSSSEDRPKDEPENEPKDEPESSQGNTPEDKLESRPESRPENSPGIRHSLAVATLDNRLKTVDQNIARNLAQNMLTD